MALSSLTFLDASVLLDLVLLEPPRLAKVDDFEDALQVACALQPSCTTLITADARMAKRYSQFIAIELLD